MMTRKDYVAIASAVKEGAQSASDDFSFEDAASRIAHALADHCAKDNPAFDRAQFLDACGPFVSSRRGPAL